MPNYDFSQFSPDIARLAAAQKQQESQGKYDAIGDNGTSHGAYQWQAPTWQAHAKEAGVDPNDFSPDTQDYVAMSIANNRINKQGYTPQQYLSEWNTGHKDYYDKGIHTKNGNVSQYVNNIGSTYDKYANYDAQNPQSKPSQSAQGPASSDDGSLGSDMSRMFSRSGAEASKFINGSNQGMVDDFLTRAEGAAGAAGYGAAGLLEPIAHAISGTVGAAGDLAGAGLNAVSPEAYANVKSGLGYVGGKANDLISFLKGKTGEMSGMSPEEVNDAFHGVGTAATVAPFAKPLDAAIGSAGGAIGGVARKTGGVLSKLFGNPAQGAVEDVTSDAADKLVKNIVNNHRMGDSIANEVGNDTAIRSPAELNKLVQDPYGTSLNSYLKDVDEGTLDRARSMVDDMASNPAQYAGKLDRTGKMLLQNYIKQKSLYDAATTAGSTAGRIKTAAGVAAAVAHPVQAAQMAIISHLFKK